MMKKHEWTNAIRSIFHRIADLDYQKRAWLGKGPEISSPDEMYCELFDDFQIEEFLTSKEIGLTEEKKEKVSVLLKKMQAIADSYPSNIDPVLLLQDPAWDEVRKEAGEAARLI